jgi:hypothetical protein
MEAGGITLFLGDGVLAEADGMGRIRFFFGRYGMCTLVVPTAPP